MTVLALATPGIGLVLMLALQRLEAWLSEAEREDPSKGRRLRNGGPARRAVYGRALQADNTTEARPRGCRSDRAGS